MGKVFSYSSFQTKKIAGLLAKEISKTKFNSRGATVLALKGDLGAGKTTFTQGFLRGLGIKKKITSPTFVLVKCYKSNVSCFMFHAPCHKFAYHIDCYRIKKSKELIDLGLKEILNNPQNIVLIEWPERIKKILPKNTIWINFEHSKNINERAISIKNDLKK